MVRWIKVFSHKYSVSEGGCHKKLLDHRVHIADAPKVSDSGVAVGRPELRLLEYGPVGRIG
jgi:hypothetical protein